MKKKSIFLLLATLLVALTSGCVEEPNNGTNNGTGNGIENGTENGTEIAKYDLWLAIGEGTSSTEKQDAHVVKKISTLLEGDYDIRKKGAETLKSGITPFVVYHKGYYYSISRTQDFGKYKITDAGVETIKRFPMPELSDRRFAHEWLDNKTLVLIGAPDSKDKNAPKKHKMNWFKINVETMEVIAKGTLEGLPKLGENDMFSSCGLLAYRKSDGKLLFNYRHEDKDTPASSPKPDSHKHFYTAVINAKDMKVESTVKEERVDRPGSVSFGSLRHKNGFFMPNDDYYMLCNTVREGATSSTQQHGYILRIKAGDNKPDPTFKIDLLENSKIISLYHMTGNKVLAYLENPTYATGKDNWKTPIRFFWAVVNLETKEQHKIEGIPFSQGGTNTELIVTEKDYVLLGISDKEQTRFFKYEYATEKVTDAAKLKPGYFADRVVVLDE